MGISHNFDEFQDAVIQAPQLYQGMVEEPLGEFIDKRFDEVATGEYMQPSGVGARFGNRGYPPRPRGLSGGLRRLSNRLARAVGGIPFRGTNESETELKTTTEGIIWLRKILVPYASIHEEGGTIPAHTVPVTEQMRSYFWAKAYETGMNEFNRWKRLALGAEAKSEFQIPSVNIPPRPYAQPALEDILPSVVERAGELIDVFLSRVLQ